jgi:hypothetical protein
LASFEVLEHVPDPISAMREFHRVCTDNVILSVPNCELPESLERSRLSYFHYTDRSHVNFFTTSSLRNLLIETGFEIVEVRLINACDTSHLVRDMFALPESIARLVHRVFVRQKFFTTTLAVGRRC